MEPEKPKRGRPFKEVNFRQVETLASIGCTQEEIATALDISVDTLARRKDFAEVYKKGRNTRTISLRHQMNKSSENGSVPMQIFLAKNLLGMKDVVLNQHAGEVTVNDAAKELLISKLGIEPTDESDKESNQLVN